MSGVDAVGCWSIAAMIWVLARGFRGAFYIVNDLFFHRVWNEILGRHYGVNRLRSLGSKTKLV